MTAPRIFIFGMGYTAKALARTIGDKAATIVGTTRANFDAAEFADATHIVVSIPPGEEDPVLARYREALIAAPALKWIGYLSSLAVYGNYGGAWVSEDTTPHPKTERAVRRHQAELEWRRVGVQRDIPVAILRIAGIYGPGRNAFVALREGRAHRIVKPGQVFNRIHVQDIAAAIAASLMADRGGILNLADDLPSPPQDVVTYASGLMNVAPPPLTPFETAELSPMARSFYADNKRADNRRLKALLGRPLAYPTYREGLQALWTGGNWGDESAV